MVLKQLIVDVFKPLLSSDHNYPDSFFFHLFRKRSFLAIFSLESVPLMTRMAGFVGVDSVEIVLRDFEKLSRL
jgi:hypothetical protein